MTRRSCMLLDLCAVPFVCCSASALASALALARLWLWPLVCSVGLSAQLPTVVVSRKSHDSCGCLRSNQKQQKETLRFVAINWRLAACKLVSFQLLISVQKVMTAFCINRCACVCACVYAKLYLTSVRCTIRIQFEQLCQPKIANFELLLSKLVKSLSNLRLCWRALFKLCHSISLSLSLSLCLKESRKT